jgi:hypothetical protein
MNLVDAGVGGVDSESYSVEREIAADASPKLVLEVI